MTHHPILATDYGNLAAFMMGIPMLFICTLVGIHQHREKRYTFAKVCGAGCLFVALVFFFSLLGDTRHTDLGGSIFVGLFALIDGLVLIFFRPSKS